MVNLIWLWFCDFLFQRCSSPGRDRPNAVTSAKWRLWGGLQVTLKTCQRFRNFPISTLVDWTSENIFKKHIYSQQHVDINDLIGKAFRNLLESYKRLLKVIFLELRDKYLSAQTLGNPLQTSKKHNTKCYLDKGLFDHLLSEPCAQQPNESQRRPTDCRLATAKAVSEHADHRRAEEDHAHGQSPNPSCGGRKNLKSGESGNLLGEAMNVNAGKPTETRSAGFCERTRWHPTVTTLNSQWRVKKNQMYKQTHADKEQ